MMKRIILCTIIIAGILLAACNGNNNKYDKEVRQAIEAMKKQWEEVYNDENFYEISRNKYLEIKNTRIIFIKDDVPDVFENIDYIIEFMIFTDYSGSAPYYSNASIYDSVVFYRDGKIVVQQKSLFSFYRSRNYTSEFSNIIKSVNDLGSVYNKAYELK